jgi:hypothetical protein
MNEDVKKLLGNQEIKPLTIPQSILDLKEKKAKPKKHWHATCEECGCKKMEYHDFRYCCPECGHVLEV